MWESQELSVFFVESSSRSDTLQQIKIPDTQRPTSPILFISAQRCSHSTPSMISESVLCRPRNIHDRDGGGVSTRTFLRWIAMKVIDVILHRSLKNDFVNIYNFKWFDSLTTPASFNRKELPNISTVQLCAVRGNAKLLDQNSGTGNNVKESSNLDTSGKKRSQKAPHHLCRSVLGTYILPLHRIG